MKLIIDIPRKVNERLRADYGHGYYPSNSNSDKNIIANAIYNGKPISDEVYNDFMDWMRKNFCCGKGESE